jgi:hypothetical protein
MGSEQQPKLTTLNPAFGNTYVVRIPFIIVKLRRIELFFSMGTKMPLPMLRARLALGQVGFGAVDLCACACA